MKLAIDRVAQKPNAKPAPHNEMIECVNIAVGAWMSPYRLSLAADVIEDDDLLPLGIERAKKAYRRLVAGVYR